MGRFANKSSKKATEHRSLIRVNPYELPEKALEVMGNICSKHKTTDVDVVVAGLNKSFNREDRKGGSWDTFYSDWRSHFLNLNFENDLNRLLIDLELEVQAHENTTDTQIVVAGGFSAGKSSFLNTLVGVPGLLPTGIEPCSMVPTYLYCSKQIKNIQVKGVNLSDAMVLLDKDVLQSIQHESKSKIYLASVLNKLFVEIPSSELDGFVFIDTPGYNNSEMTNASNGVTDEAVALEALEHGNVLLWVVDAGNGTVNMLDQQKIEKYLQTDKNRKLVILFNKADKKGPNEMKNIVNATIQKFSVYGNQLIDVLGYSSMENKIYCSANGYSLSTLFKKIRACGNGKSGVEKILAQIDRLFVDEINWFDEQVHEAEKTCKEDLDEKNKAHQEWISDEESSKQATEKLTSVLIDSYNEVLQAGDKLYNGWDKTLKHWGDFHDGVVDFDQNDHWGSSDILDKAINRSCTHYNKDVKAINEAYQYQYYDEEFRKDMVEYVRTICDYEADKSKEYYERTEKWVSDDQEEIKSYKNCYLALQSLRSDCLSTLRDGIRSYQQIAHQVQDARIKMNFSKNVFVPIAAGNYSDFTACFANGVQLNEYSPDGYSPLTFAVKEGNLQMVQFFIEHGADLSAYDKRGLNAFHTAVENGYRSICELLLKEDSTLMDLQTEKGEGLEDVYLRDGFGTWFRQMCL